MLGLLIRLILILFILYFIRKALRSLMGASTGSRMPRQNRAREIRGTMMKDPVCGTYVDTQASIRVNRNGKDFYFCSEACRRQFAAN
ncbi:MAG TPA: YHS domain-containing protein [Acidobacteriota bacterium]|jgi:YHS domain-containing protein